MYKSYKRNGKETNLQKLPRSHQLVQGVGKFGFSSHTKHIVEATDTDLLHS